MDDNQITFAHYLSCLVQKISDEHIESMYNTAYAVNENMDYEEVTRARDQRDDELEFISDVWK